MKVAKKRVLVTGGAGFIGCYLCERLLEKGAEVVILDDFSTGKSANINHIAGDVEIIRGNVESREDTLKATRGCDIVVHEAFPYGKSGMGIHEQYPETGVLGTFNVLTSAVESEVEKVIYASTVAVYGLPKYLPIDEKHPVDPFLPYGATKYVGELYCSTFARLYGLDTTSLRYFYVYGPKYSQLDHSAIVNFLHRALEKKPLLIYGNGSQIRDYTYISDAVEGTLLAIEKDGVAGEVFNISSGKAVTILELARKIADTVSEDVEIKIAEASDYKFSDRYCVVPIGMTGRQGGGWVDERNYNADITKAKHNLGYNPIISLEDGILQTMEWLRGLK